MSDNGNMNQERRQSERLDSKDQESFDSLFRQYFPKIKRFLGGFLDDDKDAEDLTQDLFVKLWQRRSTLDEIDNLNAYLFRMAKNALFTHLEQKYKHTLYPIDQIIETPSTEVLEELVFAKELEELISLAVAKMPLQRKKIFLLSRKDGISNDEIAKSLKISIRTVETHISAALSDLRKVLKIILSFFAI